MSISPLSNFPFLLPPVEASPSPRNSPPLAVAHLLLFSPPLLPVSPSNAGAGIMIMIRLMVDLIIMTKRRREGTHEIISWHVWNGMAMAMIVTFAGVAER